MKEIFWNLSLNLLSNLIGMAVGIWYSKRNFKKDRIAGRSELRRKLLKSFLFNVDRIKQMREQISNNAVPDFRLDTDSVSHLLFHGRDLFEDESWFERFNWQRYQMVHINSKLELLNDFTNLAQISLDSISSQGEVGQRRYESLVCHLEISEKEISEAVSEYQGRS